MHPLANDCNLVKAFSIPLVIPLRSASLTDRYGSRCIINTAIVLAALDFALMPWSSASLATALLAVVVWGLCGWGLLVPQQHRLISLSPASSPLLLGLNSAAVYVGVSVSGIIGVVAMTWLDRYALGLVGAVFIAAALLVAEWARLRISFRGEVIPAS
ncbi:MFS transporter [Duganella qianjiadongensis]|uniref:MFS transporter n=1 Tax=Duganella qianjiadongensis TaxID=2692176 RepID=A0ABW9VSP0_9BURK|nr:MFS transporter [Duganella qianjiadongensis]MYM42114.1 hypothetical protein [Duganella qianjiadongensis]